MFSSLRKDRIYFDAVPIPQLDVEEQNEVKPTGNQISEVPFIKEEEDLMEIQDIKIVKDEALSDNELEDDSDAALERPLGDEILRVCRSCLKVVPMEDTFPLSANGPGSKTELYKGLTGIVGLDLFSVKNPCVCKNCENFINAVQQFKETFHANEEVIKNFEWDSKTKDLLHIVDQDVLKAVYNECCKDKKQIVSHSISENFCPSPAEDIGRIEIVRYDCYKLDVHGNKLMDMKNHW
ncbi:hypothetical protein HHI36_021851 [Cryptolaemus montrouzieri]|uniref:ZAD domain-containing protein n=1 Tax=Cryptolaemus montrouzieri TaxID=559131 RepID=A0ABD2MYF9_9CUCU